MCLQNSPLMPAAGHVAPVDWAAAAHLRQETPNFLYTAAHKRFHRITCLDSKISSAEQQQKLLFLLKTWPKSALYFSFDQVFL